MNISDVPSRTKTTATEKQERPALPVELEVAPQPWVSFPDLYAFPGQAEEGGIRLTGAGTAPSGDLRISTGNPGFEPVSSVGESMSPEGCTHAALFSPTCDGVSRPGYVGLDLPWAPALGPHTAALHAVHRFRVHGTPFPIFACVQRRHSAGHRELGPISSVGRYVLHAQLFRL